MSITRKKEIQDFASELKEINTIDEFISTIREWFREDTY